MSASTIEIPKIVSENEWLTARRELLRKEKDFTRLRDELTAQRRELPWVKVGKRYEFEGSLGRQTLPDLFDGQSQLVIYHFMFDPDWDAGCKSCSFESIRKRSRGTGSFPPASPPALRRRSHCHTRRPRCP